MPSNESPRRLLIVEDNPTDEMLLERFIREEGLRVEIAVVRDGEKAIEYLENCADDQVPHLAVIDINLPKLDGIDVLRKCRFLPRLAETKTLILTSSDDSNDHSRSELLGVDAYLRKPAELDDFKLVVSAIRTLLGMNLLGAGG